MKRYIFALLLVCIPIAAYAITTNFTITVATGTLNNIFNCSSFAPTGACATGFIGSGSGFTFKVVGSNNGATPGFSGSQVNLVPLNSQHAALNMNYQPNAVSVGQFSTTFTFIPDGQNVSFILSNNTAVSANPAAGGNFSGGASGEGAFFQGYDPSGIPPNNTFAVMLDQATGNLANSNTFTYSSVQYYDTGHSPPNAPNAPGQWPSNGVPGGNFTVPYVGVSKISTSPVPLNNPPGTLLTTTKHTYSVTITYDGSNLVFSMFDVTAGGACPGATCFTNTWTGVNIPAIVGGPTAWVGLGGSTGEPNTDSPLLINSWSYSAAPVSLNSVFNCSAGFATAGTCGVFFTNSGSDAGQGLFVVGSFNGSNPALAGSAVNLVPAGANHVANNMNWRSAKVNVGQFSTTFTFVPNGWNLAFILNNSNNNPTFNGNAFSAGAGCEAAFFQAFGQASPPNNVFALELDQASNLLASNQSGPGGGLGQSPSYSSVQYYDTGHDPPNPPNAPGRSPCIPDLGTDMTGLTYIPVNKVSTSPVPLNNPPTTVQTTTGHTYSATITYDGSNLTISLFDVTAGGACPGAACFTNTWTGVNIPAIVGGTTAWVGLGGGTNNSLPNPLLINSWSYSSN